MLDIRTWPTPLAPLDVPRAAQVVAHVGDEPDRLFEVLTCPSTRQAFVVDRVICGDKAPAVRIVLAKPVDPVPHDTCRFRRRPGRAVAIKIFVRRQPLPSQGYPDEPDLEIAAMHLLSSPGHPNVAPLLGCMQDEKHTYLVTNFYEGGDLFDLVSRRSGRRLPGLDERQARAYFLQILDGLEYMHARKIAHR
jgi:serine/threonine protein kinase